MGVFGFTPGSIAKSKSSPERSPCSLIGFLAVTVPFTDHTPVSMFFIAAFTSGSRFSWPGPAGFFCGLAKAKGVFENTKNAAIAQIQVALIGMVFFMFVLIRSVADGDDGRSFSGPIHRHAITERGTAFARITHFWLASAVRMFGLVVRKFGLVVTPLPNIRAPTFDLGTIRCLRTAG